MKEHDTASGPHVICHLMAPTDGRTRAPAVFDGLAGQALFPLRLKSVERRGETLWIRYDAARPLTSQEGRDANA